MKFILILLSLYVPAAPVPYRQLSWSDYRRPAPSDRPLIAAETAVQLAYQVSEYDGKSTFSVRAYVLPESSFVRFRTDYYLRHEQTHFKITQITALRCTEALAPLQHGDTSVEVEAERIYDRYWEESAARQDQFDAETTNGQNKQAEKIWDLRISDELAKFETSPKSIHGRNH